MMEKEGEFDFGGIKSWQVWEPMWVRSVLILLKVGRSFGTGIDSFVWAGENELVVFLTFEKCMKMNLQCSFCPPPLGFALMDSSDSGQGREGKCTVALATICNDEV